MSVAELRREARLSKPPSDDDADTARGKRTLRFGRARLAAELPVDQMATIRKCQLLALGDRDGGTYAPYGQRRADALHDLGTTIPNAPPGLDPKLRDVIWN